jgi:hypothetical protein
VAQETRRYPSNRSALLDFAKCMRQHGIPYNDPAFPPGGIFGGGTSSQDSNSPAVKQAATVCNKALRSETSG